MARVHYASPERYEELMRDIRLPADTACTNAFGVLAHTPAIGGSVLKLVHTILTEADLDFFLHELVILRMSQRCPGRYAWTQHMAIAQSIGLTDAQATALERGDAQSELFTPRERAVLAFTDEVLDGPRVSEDTFERVHKEFSAREIVELLITIGYHRMIESLFTTLDLELDPPWATELLEPATHATLPAQPILNPRQFNAGTQHLCASFDRYRRFFSGIEQSDPTVIDCGDRCRI